MEDRPSDTLSNHLIEILPPEREDCCGTGTKTCSCCDRSRPASAMDDDGCGICEECLRP